MGAAGHSGVKSDPDPGKGLGWSCDFVILFGIFSFWDYYCSFRRVCYIFFFFSYWALDCSFLLLLSCFLEVLSYLSKVARLQ
jgi:hypothetical protein